MPEWLRRVFRLLNKYWMVPLFRLGLGPWIVNPFTGYIMVLITIGRRSGKRRYAPVNYAILEGAVYCVSGGRTQSDWYRNLLATTEINVLMPGGIVRGTFEEVTAADERLTAARHVLRNAGFAGFFEGYNPFTIPDEELREKTADLPVLRLRVPGLVGGAVDPGGWGWLLSWAVFGALMWALRPRRR